MTKKPTQNFTYWLKVIVIGIALGLGLQFVRAWTEPTTAPPGGNVGAPINTSGNYQTKSGGLSVLGGVSTTGLSASSYVSTPYVWSTNISNTYGIYSGNYVQSPVFYDTDSNFYLNPNGASNIVSMNSVAISAINYVSAPDVWSNTIHNSGWTSTYGLCLNGDCRSSWPASAPSCTCINTVYKGTSESQDCFVNYRTCPGWGGWWEKVSGLGGYWITGSNTVSQSGSVYYPCYPW